MLISKRSTIFLGLLVQFLVCRTFVNINDNFYFSGVNDNQKGSVEEQLSIMKAIFLGGKSTFIF